MNEVEFWEKLTAFLEDIVIYDDSETNRKAAYLLVKEFPARRARIEVVSPKGGK